MRWNRVKAVFLKDGTELIRDIRTIIAMVLFPVIFIPLFMVVAGIQETQTVTKRSEEKYIALAEESLIKEFFTIENENLTIQPFSQDFQKILQNEEADIYIQLEGDEFLIHFDGGRSDGKSQRAAEMFVQYLNELNIEKIKKTLKENQISEEILNPPLIRTINMAPKEKVSGFELARFLPIVVLLMVMNLLAHPAIDSMTGEKERGTAESLLALPLRAKEIIFGKFLVIGLLALIAISLNIALLMTSIHLMGGESANFFSHFLMTIFGSIPMIVFFSGALIFIASSSRSTKEASSYLHTFVLVFMIFAFVSLSGDNVSNWVNWVPGIGAGVSLKSWLTSSGNTVSWISAFWTTAIGIGLLNASAYQFKSENTILGMGGINWKQWWKKERDGTRYASISETMMSFVFIFIVFLLLSYFGEANFFKEMPQGQSLLMATFVAQIGAMLVLPHFINKTLGLKRDYIFQKGFKFGFYLLLFGLGAWLLGLPFGYIGESIWPSPPEFEEIFAKLIDQNSITFLIFVVGIMPGITEEIVFRGFILHGFKKLGTKKAIFFSSLLFALMHMHPARFLFTFVLGVLFAMLTIRTGTIWYAVIIHFLVNTISVIIAKNNLFADSLISETSYNDSNALTFFIFGLIGFAIIKALWKKIPIFNKEVES